MSQVELRGEEQFQLMDAVDVFDPWRECSVERRRRFSGSMRWVERNGKSDLLRKIGSRERSLGPASPEMREAFDRFVSGRDADRERLSGLSGQSGRHAII